MKKNLLKNLIYAFLTFGLPLSKCEDTTEKMLWGIEAWIFTIMIAIGLYVASAWLSGFALTIIVGGRLLAFWWKKETEKEIKKMVKNSIHP